MPTPNPAPAHDERAILDEKRALRAELLARRAAIPPEERARASHKICTNLKKCLLYERAPLVLLYAPVRGEVDVWEIFDDAVARGKTVGFPRVSPLARGIMDFFAVQSRDFLTPGAHNIPEPDARCPLLPREGMPCDALIVVPAIAFDCRGYRLGYGGGYYDRYLPLFPGASVGVCYARLILDALPTGENDARVGAVVGEEKIF